MSSDHLRLDRPASERTRPDRGRTDRSRADRKRPGKKRSDKARTEQRPRTSERESGGVAQWFRKLTSSAGSGLDSPLDASRRNRRTAPALDTERFGRASERFARFMGTASFLIGMTVFVGGWLAWNWIAPENLQFDPRRLNFTLMTLLLSLQASYAAPLILLAQNRQADRDRVSAEQDRDRAERSLADTEYLAREVAALRIALNEVATRDFVRSELRTLLEEFGDRPASSRPKKKSPKSQKDVKESPNGGSNGAVRPAPAPTDNGAESSDHRSGLTNDTAVPTESS